MQSNLWNQQDRLPVSRARPSGAGGAYSSLSLLPYTCTSQVKGKQDSAWDSTLCGVLGPECSGMLIECGEAGPSLR